MLFADLSAWFRFLRGLRRRTARPARKPRRRTLPDVEQLETRWLMSTLSPPTVLTQASGLGEGSTALVTVTNFPANPLPVTVDYTTHDDTALAGTDYTATSGTLTFAPYQTGALVQVPILDDGHDANPPTGYGGSVPVHEDFKINWSNPVNAVLDNTQTIAPIYEDSDPITAQFKQRVFNVNENQGQATITVTIVPQLEPTALPVTVHYQTEPCDCGAESVYPGWPGELPAGVDPAVPGTDYTDVGNDLVFNYPDSSKTFTVPILDDKLQDGNEGLRLRLSYPRNATLSQAGNNPLVLTADGSWAVLIIQDSHTTQTTGCGGKPTEQDFSGGAKRKWTYDSSGNCNETSYTNELNRTSNFTYDGTGHMLTSTDPLGQTTTMTYDAAGQVLSVIRPGTGGLLGGGTETDYRYDGQERLTTLTNPDGTTEQFTYDAAGNVATRADERNLTTTFTYDGRHELLTRTDPLGAVTTYSYDSQGNRASVTDPLGNTTTYTYDSAGRVLTTTDALNHTTTSSYDSGGAQTSVTDPLNHTTTFAYDSSERLISATDPLGNRTTYTYDDVNHINTVKDALGHTSTMVYDARGRLLQNIAATGAITSYTYDAAGERLTMTDPLGHTSTFAYDLDGRQVSVTNALGQTATTVYGYLGETVAQIDALGRALTYTYDSMGRQTSVTDPLGDVTTTAYDNAGNVQATTDARGDTTTFTYDNANRQVQVQDALGDLTTTVYDRAGNTLATIDARGNRTTFAYDAANRRTQATDAAGDVTTTVYDAVGNTLAAIDAWGNRTTFAYDAVNRQVQTTDALNDVSTVVYDAAGNVTAHVDPFGNRTTFTYDALNRQVTSRDPLNLVTTTTYDTAGNVVARTNPRGYTTTFTYDALNRQTQTTDAANDVSTVVYDAAGNVSASIDARGDRTTFTYDALNRRVSQTDALNHTNTTVYDATGNVSRTLDALGNTTTFTYDALNRQVSVQDPGGGVATTVYDAAGNVVNTIDALNHKSTVTYDALNRQTRSVDPLGDTTTMTYDANSNVVNVIDPDSNKTTFTYDALNRKASEVDPLGHAATFAYDAAGRLASSTDRDGRRDTYAYDADGRLLTETWVVAGSTVNTLTFTYDADGNKLTAANGSGAYTMAYDSLDRVANEQEPFGAALTFSYDATSNRTGVQDSFSGVQTSVYSAVNLLGSRQQGGSGQTPLRVDLAYTARNQVATVQRYSALDGSVQVGESDYSYDAMGRLTNLQHKGSGGTSLANTTYTYDLASRVLTETRNSATTTYAYDAANQLTSAGTATYSYDANGNRTMTGYVTGTGNELQNDGTWQYTYDSAGNLIEKFAAATGDIWDYTYNNANQMVSAVHRWNQDPNRGVVPSGTGALQLTVTYTYDAFGQRLEEIVLDNQGTNQNADTRFAYDRGNVWADLNASNGLVMRRLYLDGVDQPVARVNGSGTAAWYLADRLGSVRDLVNYAGTTVLDHLDYDGYGNVTNETAPSSGDRYKFTAREFDSVTGQQYNRARYYDSRIGRWISRDPLGFGGEDQNLYRYVRNAALNKVDPSGLRPTKVIITSEGWFDKRVGQFAWPVSYQLNDFSDKDHGGYVVQQVEFHENIKDAQGQYVVPIYTQKYLEAWRVPKHSKTLTLAQGALQNDIASLRNTFGNTVPRNITYDDDYLSLISFPQTVGSIDITGQVYYFDCMETLPAAFAVGNSRLAVSLPSVDLYSQQYLAHMNPLSGDPDISWVFTKEQMQKAIGPFPHSIKVSWDDLRGKGDLRVDSKEPK
jgi:RHS repeat-associated protein